MPIFMKSLRELAKHDDARWASVTWFSRDFRALVKAMEPDERAEMLATLSSLPELDYQVEDILYEIGQHDLQGVVDFLVGRLKHARLLTKQERATDGGGSDVFEPIPYQLSKLSELLARAPGALVSAVRDDFDQEDRLIFSYRAAHLVKAAFPTFDEPLKGLLLNYVGTDSEDDIEFVIGVLRAYEGSPSILEVCKAIIKTTPERSRIWNEVAAVIESTGVVTGEYGMVQALEAKQQEVSGWMNDQDGRVQAFAQWLTEGLQPLIEHERRRADEGLALRKYHYGIRKDED
jgi:hypothetical protein